MQSHLARPETNKLKSLSFGKTARQHSQDELAENSAFIDAHFVSFKISTTSAAETSCFFGYLGANCLSDDQWSRGLGAMLQR
jgi:hypothetical protein